MALYPPPKRIPINEIFNLNDFVTVNEDPITEFEADDLYIKKNGTDVVNSLLTFNSNISMNDSSLYIYDDGANQVGAFNNLGELVCTKINNVSNTQISYLENLTSDVQNQLDSVQNKTTDMLAYDGGTLTSEFNNKVKSSDLIFANTINNISNSTFNYLSGVTSNIQTQFGTINTTNSTQNGRLDSLETKTTQQSYTTGLTSFSGNLSCSNLTCTSFSNGQISNTELNYLDNIDTNIKAKFTSYDNSHSGHSSDLTALQNKTSDMLAYNSGTTTSEFNNVVKANKLNFTTEINGISNTTFSYLSGATSNIQTQIDSKPYLSDDNTFTGSNLFNGNTVGKYNSFGSNNIFNATAISNPLVRCGFSNGTGDGASYSTFDNAINSWLGTGFIDTTYNTCNLVINHRNGDISTKGKIICTDFTNGQISNTELNYLDNIDTNIKTKFTTLDSTNTTQNTNITNLQNKTTDLLSYNSGTTTSEFNNTVKANKLNFTTDINGVTDTTFSYLDATSSIQTQINLKGNHAGVYLLNGENGVYNWYPLQYANISHLNNITNQTYTSGTTNYNAVSGSPVGGWSSIDIQDTDDRFYLLDKFGIIGYDGYDYTGGIMVNFYNDTGGAVLISPSSVNRVASCKIYYNLIGA